MADFTFTSPQGKSYTVTGPDGATAAQAFQMLQQHLGTGNNPAQTKQAGYQASDTGQFIPIQNAGQQAPAPTGNPALGALQGASNTILGADNSMAAGAYATLKPHSTMDQASDNFDQANQFLQGNQIGPSADPLTEGARQAVMGAASKLSAVPQQMLEPRNLLSLMGIPKAGMLLDALNKTSGAAKVKNAINQSPALVGAQNVLSTGSDVAANVLPMVVGGKTAPAAADISLTPKQQILQMAQQKYGLKIAPGEAGGAPIASALEDITGAAMAEKLATAKNQPMVNKVGAQEIQQPQMTSFTKNNIASSRTAPNAQYNQVGKLGTIPADGQYVSDFSTLHLNPRSKGTIPSATNDQITELQTRLGSLKSFDAQDALNEIGDLRNSGWKNMKADDPEDNRLGGVQLRAADAMENNIDRYVSSRPEGFDDPGMIQRWRDARTLLAKIHTVEGAKVGTDLSVPKLVRAYNNGAPLSDGLKDLAQIGEQFPNSLKDASRIRGPRTFTKLSTTMGGAGMLGAAALGHPAVAAAVGGAMIGTPILRNALLSRPIQSSLIPKPGMDPALLRILMGGAPAALNAQGDKQ